MNWNYPNQYVTPSWSPYHQPNQFDHQLDPTYTGRFSSKKLYYFFFFGWSEILHNVLNNTQLTDVHSSPDPRLLADFNHLDRQLAVAYSSSGLNSESSSASSGHQVR